MMSPDSGHEKPSRYIASTNWKWPILWPHRASAASTRYGMRLIDSMPPATTTDDSPSRMLCAPEAIACRPEAHALLIVWAGRGVRKTGAMADLARRVRARPGLAAVPDEHFVYGLGGHAGPRQRRPHGHRPELRGVGVLQRAAIAADRRAGRSEDHDVAEVHRPTMISNACSNCRQR